MFYTNHDLYLYSTKSNSFRTVHFTKVNDYARIKTTITATATILQLFD